MSFLTVKNIDHTYFSAKHPATQRSPRYSFTIEKGEFISFLGPSGCGKTTLLSIIIAGLFTPTPGTVLLERSPYFQGTRLTIGYMLQQDYLFPWKTIEENIHWVKVIET